MTQSSGSYWYELDLLLNHYRTLGKIVNLLEPLFTHLKNDYNDYMMMIITIPMSCCENKCDKACIAQCLAHINAGKVLLYLTQGILICLVF